MANVRDCFKKLGSAVSKSDRAGIVASIAGGMSDAAAVRAALGESAQDIMELAARIEEAGGKVERLVDPLGNISEMQRRLLDNLHAERVEIAEKTKKIKDELDTIEKIEALIRKYPKKAGISTILTDLNDPVAVETTVSQMLFNQDQTEWAKVVALGLKGTHPLEIVEAFMAQQERKLNLQMQQRTNNTVQERLDARMQTVFYGERRNIISETQLPKKLFQDIEGGALPWTLKSSGEGDLYIRRHGVNAGMPFRERQGPNDFAITFDKEVLLTDYMYYLLQYLQPKIAARARGTAQQAIRIRDISEVILEHFLNNQHFQGIDRPMLQALHNLTGENLAFTEKMGGLAVPSIAVLPEGGQMTGFGEITLIGTKDLGDPQQMPLFDADAYAVRYPKPEFPRAELEGVNAMIDEARPWSIKIEGLEYAGLTDMILEYSRRTPDANKLIHFMMQSNAVKAWFLSERYGQDSDPTMQDIRPRFVWGWQDEIIKFFKGDLSAAQLDWDDPRRIKHMKEAGRRVKKAIRTYYYLQTGLGFKGLEGISNSQRAEIIHAKTEAFIDRAGIINTDGSLTQQAYSRLKADAALKDSQQIDDVNTRDYLDMRINAANAETAFKEWVDAKVLGIMGDPRIKIGSKWFPYTLEHIVRKMKGKLRGTETWFPTEGMLRAKAAKRIKNFPEARRRALTQIGTYDEVNAARTVAQTMVAEWAAEISQWYPNLSTTVQSWSNASEAAREALAFWAQNGDRLGDVEAMKIGLERAGFLGEFPDWVITQGLDAGAAFLAAPVPYFEGKPQRAVMLNEFVGAVIPRSATAETRAILAKNGIVYREYPDGAGYSAEGRTEAVAALQQQLNDQGERTLFQSEIGFTSGLLDGARAMTLEKGPAADMLGALRKMPGVTGQELAIVGVEDWLEAKYGYRFELDKKKRKKVVEFGSEVTKEELVAYIEANGIQVIETQLGGEYVPEPHWTMDVATDAAYDKYDLVYGDPDGPYIRTAIDIRTGRVFEIIIDEDAGNVSVTEDDGKTWLEIDAPINSQTIEDAKEAMAKLVMEDQRKGFARTAENTSQQVQGGDQFREILLHLPLVPPEGRPFMREDFTEGHFEEENIVAFLLVTDRIGPNGERIMFIEEFQSDWHQRGKRHGYRKPVPPIPDYQIIESSSEWIAVTADGEELTMGMLGDTPYRVAIMKGGIGPGLMDGATPLEAKRSNDAARLQIDALLAERRDRLVKEQSYMVPEGPFKGNAWMTLALKRAMRLAVEGGYDQLAWSTGAIINDRRGYARNLTTVKFDPRNGRYMAFDKDMNQILDTVKTDEEMRDMIGLQAFKDLRDQIEPMRIERFVHLADVGPERVSYVEDDLRQQFMTILLDDADKAAEELAERASRDQLWVSYDKDGLMERDQFGAILISRTKGGMKSHVETKRYGDRLRHVDLPTVRNLNITHLDERGVKMNTYYDETTINMANKAARKLDPDARVKPRGQFLPDADEMAERLLDAQRLANMSWNSMEEALQAGEEETAAWHKGNFERHVSRVKSLEQQQAPGPEVHVLDITERLKKSALLGMTYFQDKHRGSITFDAQRKAITRLTASRNLSTFLHEGGHLYLEIMADLAEDAIGPRQVIGDWQKILEYLGVNHRSEITGEHHELFAKAFELYLEEGKAPSHELQGMFNTFASWLSKVYEKIQTREAYFEGVVLNDEIRGVMDRILAVDEAITEAEGVQEFRPIFSTAEEMNVSQEVFDVYKAHIQQAHQGAFDEEFLKMIRFMNRKAQVWWSDEKAKVEAEVREEMYALPVYRALAMFQYGKNPDGSEVTRSTMTLNKADLVKRKGKAFLKLLPRPWIYRVKTGVDADVAALRFGFENANTMLEAILKAPPLEAIIAAETDKRMLDRYPDPLIDGTIAADALVAVHNEKRVQILAAELREFRKRMKADKKIVSATKREAARADREAREANKGMLPNRGELAIIKRLAKEDMDARKIRDVNPNKYRLAEKKHGRLAFEAAERGDWETAYYNKLKQIRNHESFRAATKAQEETTKIRDHVATFEKVSKQRRLGKSGMLDKILAVIEGTDLRRISLAQVDRETALQELADAVHSGAIVMSSSQANELYHVTVDENGEEHVIINRGYGTNWQDMTVADFRDMGDTLKQLEHEASRLAKGILNDEKALIQDGVGAIVDQVLENNKFIPAGVSQPTVGEKGKRALKQGIVTWLRPSSMARILDGEGFGALTKWVIVPIRRAYSEKLIPGLKKAQKDVSEIYLNNYTNDELGHFNDKVWVEAMGEELTRAERISIIMNWGSASGRQALLGGIKRDGTPAYTEQAVRAVLATLEAKDVAFMNEMWEYLDSYWPALKEAEQRRRGIAPQKVEALPFTFTTADGQEVTAIGGYYPLRYDRRHSQRVKIDELDDVMKKMGNGVYITAQTRAGATFERTQNHGRVVRLGLHTIDLHLREVIRDITIGDEVNFIKRVLNDEKLAAAFENTNNDVALQALNLWLTDAAVGELPAEGFWENGVAYIRTGFVKAKLAWNLMTTFLQFTGIFQTMAVIGTQAYGHGVGKLLQNPVENWKFVMETSKFMHTRYVDNATFDKDIIDVNAHLNAFFGPTPTRVKQSITKISSTFFYPIAKAQSIVDVTTWLGAYWKGRNVKNLSDADSVIYADVQVENAQTSGFYSDRSNLERGTMGRKNRQAQFIRIWTTLISYMLAKGNIAYEKGVAFKKKPSLSGAVYLATDLLLLWTMEGIASAWIYGQLPDDDDDESWGWWTVKATLDSAASGIPFVREVPGAKFGGGNTAIGSLSDDIYSMGQQIAQWEIDEAFIKNANNIGGTLFHYPSSQTNRLVDAYWAEDEPELYEWATGERD